MRETAGSSRPTHRQSASSFFISSFRVATLVLVLGACKANPGEGPSRQPGEKTDVSAVVLFAVGSVHATDSLSSPGGRRLKPGDVVSGDKVITVGNRSLCDLQIRDARGAFVIRLNESTRVKINAVKFPRHKTFEVSVYRGNALFRVNSQGEERLRVITPTAAAFVRGTSFQVTVRPNGTGTVAIHEGRVMVLPHIPAIQNIPRKVVDSSPTLTRITDQLYKWRKLVKAGHEITTDGSYLNGLIQNSPKLSRTLNLPVMKAVRFDSKGKPAQIKQAMDLIKRELDDPATQKKILNAFEQAKPNRVLPPANRMDAKRFRRELKQYEEMKPLTPKELGSSANMQAAIKRRHEHNYEELLQSIARLMKRPVDTLKLIDGGTLRGVIIQQGRDYLVLTPGKRRLVREEDLSEIRFKE